jgi:hypothetical protein
MKENGSFLRDYLLGHGGTSEVSPELKATMNRNSESVALLLTSKVPGSDLPQPIADSESKRTAAINVER